MINWRSQQKAILDWAYRDSWEAGLKGKDQRHLRADAARRCWRIRHKDLGSPEEVQLIEPIKNQSLRRGNRINPSDNSHRGKRESEKKSPRDTIGRHLHSQRRMYWIKIKRSRWEVLGKYSNTQELRVEKAVIPAFAQSSTCAKAGPNNFVSNKFLKYLS